MIYSITLNPALDISGTVKALTPNEKNYVHDEFHTPGGNGINAAIIAHRLHAELTATGFLGGPNGAEIKLLLKKEEIKNDFVSIAGNTRMNLTISNLQSHLQTRLSFAGPLILPKELNVMKQFIQRILPLDIVIIGGSLPPGVNPNFLVKIVSEFRKKRIFCMLDIPGIYLKEVIQARPAFIKPNLLEFSQLSGKKIASINSVLIQSQKYLPLIPIICVSSIEGGAILQNESEAWFGKLPKVKIRSTVGAGDSMVGAMAAMLQKNIDCPMDELLRIGLAAACATLTEPGMILGSQRAILSYLPKIHLQKLIIPQKK